MSLQIYLSPIIQHQGYTLSIRTEAEWNQVIEHLNLFMTFSDEKVGQRILIHTDTIITGSRQTIYTDYLLTRVQGGWSKQMAIYTSEEQHPYLHHINMYVEIQKRRGVWKGFMTS